MKPSTAPALNVSLIAGSIPTALEGRSEPSLHREAARNGCTKVKAPTLVIHGTADPLVDPKAGQDTAVSIPGAKLMMVQGMGHAIPMAMWPEIIDAIDKHAHRAGAKAA